MFSLVVTLVVLALVAVGVILGLLRGLNRSLVRFGAVVLAAFIAFGIATAAYPMIADKPLADLGVGEEVLGMIEAEISNPTLQDFLNYLLLSNDVVAELAELSPTLVEFILILPQALVAEVLFIILFFVVKLLLWIVQFFFNIFLLKKKKRRLIAALVGGLQGLFCACILLLPILGIMPIADQVVAIGNEYPTYDEDGNKVGISLVVDEIDREFCTPIHEDPTYAFLDAVGIRSICTNVFYKLSSVTNENGETRSFFLEIEQAAPAVFNVMQLTGISFDNLTEQDVALIKSTVTTIQNSSLLSGVVSDVLINGSDALASGNSILGFTLPEDMDEKTSTFLGDVLSSIASTESKKLIDDLPNVVDAAVTITQSGIIGGDASMTDILTDTDTTVNLLSSLANSSTLSPATISAVNTLGISQLGEALNIAPEEVENMFISDTEIFNNMTPEEREAEVEKLAGLLSSSAEIIEKFSAEGEVDLIDLLPEAGKLLDDMSNSALLGEATKGVVDGLLNSEAAKEIITDEAKDSILDKIENGDINFESTLSGIGAAHNLSQSITVGNGNVASDENVIAAVEQLFGSIDETTAEILKATLSSVLLQNMGVPEEAAEIAVIVFDTLLDEIAKFSPDDSTDYAKEAAAIESTLNFVTKIMENPNAAVSEETIYDLLDTALESETITNTIITASASIDLSHHFDDATLAEIDSIISAYENAAASAERVHACANALRSVFGIEA